MTKTLQEVLDTVKVKNEEFSYDEFFDKIESQMEGYIVNAWNHDDYVLCDLPRDILWWVNETLKGKVLEDLQVETYETTDDISNKGYFTVIAIKMKGVCND